MFRQVLVPLDGSHLAEQAIDVGARVARTSGGTLILVDVVRGLAEFEAGVVPAKTWAPAAVEAERQAAKAYLTAIARRQEGEGTRVQIAVYAGPPSATLLLASREHHADLIVMTTHGRTGLARWALGSVAHKMVHRSPVPILLLRDGGAASLSVDPGANEPLRALVPLDRSPLAEAALLPAVRLVAALAGPQTGPRQAALHLVRVVDAFDVVRSTASQGMGSATWEQSLAHALDTSTTYLSKVAEGLGTGEAGDLGVPVNWSVVYDQQSSSYEVDVAQAILRTATVGEPVAGASAPSRCNLIAMATHGRSGFSRWAMGSIAERVLQASALPVLLIGPHAEPEAA